MAAACDTLDWIPGHAMHSTQDSTTNRTRMSHGPRRPGQRVACVIVIHGEGLGKRADVGEQPLVVGRSSEADLHLPHQSVSRKHCTLWRVDNGYRIRDLGATNPTRLNDLPMEREQELPINDGDHLTVGESILKFISHVSVEASYHEAVYQLATHDSLTELCNRRHFQELLDKEMARAKRHDRPLALCILDVDLFKPVNDQYGHVEGDHVLREIAKMTRNHIRAEDIAARIGGEEFAILIPESGQDAALAFAERLRKAVEGNRFELGGEVRQITVSIGLAMLGPEHGKSKALLEAADAQLYRAKNSGRNRVCAEP